MASRRVELEAIDALLRLTDVVERRRAQMARQVGLTDAQWRVLEEVGQEDFLPSLFARDRRLQPAAVSRTLRELAERGWVRPLPVAGDRRKREYVLTVRGGEVLERLRAAREEALVAVWDGLPADELAGFQKLATRLADGLEAYHAEVERVR